MITIGIRAAPSAVTFVIYDIDANAIVNVEKLQIPIALQPPDALKYVRNNLIDILREYDVTYAGVESK